MISELLTCKEIKVNLESTEKEECFAELLEPLVAKFRQLNRSEAMSALLAREELKSTAILPGVAIPHAVTSKKLGSPAIAIGISKNGIEFDSVDSGINEKNPIVKLIFEIFFEEDDAVKHLQVLRDILQLVSNQHFLKEVLKAESSQEVMDIIKFFEG
ncbi:MAG: PTS sugar transporter subunit IIA [Treponema sp.]|nr:PTS sugar transporter subunit IIA [Treponema sp.]